MGAVGRTASAPQNAVTPARQDSLGPLKHAAPSPPQQPKLLDRLREALRSRHYSRRTEQCYCHWVKRFIFFHHVRHPAIGEVPVSAAPSMSSDRGYTGYINPIPEAGPWDGRR
jgi:hypothetical protein